MVQPVADVLADLFDGLVGVGRNDQRLATCPMGSSSAAFSISIWSSTLCFCSAISDRGAPNPVFSNASSGSVSRVRQLDVGRHTRPHHRVYRRAWLRPLMQLRS
jgi:hypothetical protein